MELLRDVLGIALPAFSEVRIDGADLTDLEPPSRFADVVVRLEDTRPVFGIVIEVQLDIDPDQLFSWPAYLANLRSRLRYNVELLVFTPASSVAVRTAARAGRAAGRDASGCGDGMRGGDGGRQAQAPAAVRARQDVEAEAAARFQGSRVRSPARRRARRVRKRGRPARILQRGTHEMQRRTPLAPARGMRAGTPRGGEGRKF